MVDTSYAELMQNLVVATKTLFPDNKVFRGKINGTEPLNPYITINIIRDMQMGLASQATLLNNGKEMEVLTNWEALVQFSFTSIDENSAGNLAKMFAVYLNMPTTREVFRQNHLAKVKVSNIRNVSYKRETVWTQYFNIDVTFYYAILTKQEMFPIEVVEMTDLISGEVFTAPPDVIII